MHSTNPGRSSAVTRRRDIAELCLGYGLILVVVWTPVPWQRRVYLIAAMYLLATSFRAGADWRQFGLSTRNLLQACIVPLIAALVVLASVIYAAHRGTLHAPGTLGGIGRRFWGYGLWSFAQQFLLQDFFLLRFRRLLPGRDGRPIVLSAVVFALAHLPNPLLTVFTLIWGLVACLTFVRYRNLYPLGIAHALLGICVAVCLPAPMTHNMRVGLGYLHYHHGQHHRSSSDHAVSTKV